MKSAPEAQSFARFRVVREIGRGAQGAIFEAVDLERDVRVAIKTLHAVGADEIARIKSEFRAVRALRHPSLVRIGDLVEEGGRWFFTMELVEGVNLLSHVRGHSGALHASSWSTPSITRVEPARFDAAGAQVDPPAPPPSERPAAQFDEPRLRHTLAQLASVLEYLHAAGKVHRDLKPSNVLVDAEGRAVLIDFGVAGELADEDDYRLVGTVPYMAPEQVLGEAVGTPADWYAFGVILFEALTGRRPFEGTARSMVERKTALDAPRPSDFVRDVPPELEALCVRLLSREASARATGEDVMRALGMPSAATASQGTFFVGRSRELGVLRHAFDEASAGRAVAVVLEGESGVGKSALARRFVDDLRASDARPLVLSGRCHEHESVPYNAFDAVIDGLGRHLRARKASTRAELLPPNMDRLQTLFATLREMDGQLPPAPAPAPLDPRAVREDGFGALRELLHRVARRWPTVILLEDVQWADTDSLALLERITETPSSPELLLLVTAREGAGGAECAAVAALRGDVRRLPIRGLEVQEAGALVERLLDRAGTRGSVDADAIVESAAGHPMFIEELVQYLARPRARFGGVGLDDALRARVSELDEETRNVLGVVCVAGAATEQMVVATAAGLPFASYSDVVARLHEARLVRIRGPRADEPVEPFHDRIRETVTAALPAAKLAAIHGALARALEARDAGPELLLHHFAAAGQRERAAHYAELAAAAAERALAFDRAAELYRRALSLGERSPERRRHLLATIGERLVDAGRSKEAARYFLEAASTGEPSKLEHLDLVRRAAERFLMSGHVEEGLTATRAAFAASGLSWPTTWLGAVTQVGWYRTRLSRRSLAWKPRAASEVDAAAAVRMDLCWSVAAGLGLVDSIRSVLFFARGALESLDGGDDERIARALAGAAIAETGLLRRADAARLQAACERAVSANVSDRARFYPALGRVADKFFLANDWPATLEASREARGLWRATGRTEGWEVDIIDQFECWALDNGGRLFELAERVPAKIRAAQRAGNRFVEVNYRTQFVNLRLREDRPDEARQEVEDAIAAWPSTGSSFANQHYLALRGLTVVALYERDERAAIALLPRWKRYFTSLLGRAQFLRMDALWNVGSIALLRASKALARGGASEVAPRLREAGRAFEEAARIDIPYARGNALLLRIGIATMKNDAEAAMIALHEGIRDAEARGSDLHAAVMRARLAVLLGGSEGAALRETADAWMKRAGVRDPARLMGTVLVARD